MTARKVAYEAWNLFSLGAVSAQDELVVARNTGQITEGEYWGGTFTNAGTRIGALAVGGGAAGLGLRAAGGGVTGTVAAGSAAGFTTDLALQGGDMAIHAITDGAAGQEEFSAGRLALSTGGGAALGGLASSRLGNMSVSEAFTSLRGMVNDVAAGRVVPNANFPEGLAYRSDLPTHLSGPDGFTKSGQLAGTHNLQNATAALDARGASYSVNPTGTGGISDLQYTYTNAATGKVVSGSKTVYDPAVFSDQKMLDYSMRAGQVGWERYLQNPAQRVFDVSHEGINFRTYINTDKYGNAFVGNVHPIK